MIFFGLSYLPCEEVPLAFVSLLLTAPLESDFLEFATYISDNYINCTSFPPKIWAAAPSTNCVATTNAAESLHSQQRTEFYTPHPSIFQVIKSVAEQQPLRLLKMSAAANAKLPIRRKEWKEKEPLVAQLGSVRF